jgi:integrase
MYKLVNGANEGAVVVTVREHVTQWVKTKQNEVSAASMEFYTGSAKRFLDYLGSKADRSLFEISKQDLVGYRDRLASEVSAVRANHLFSTAKALFKSAKADDLISDDPAENINAIKVPAKKNARRAFSPAELQAILSVASPEWASMVRFGLYTGQRLSDLTHLKWSNIDMENGVISLVTGKTGRLIVLPIAEGLREHIASLPTSDDPQAPIHATFAKREQSGLSSEFGKLLIKAGIRKAPDKTAPKTPGRRREQGECFHYLRHTATSVMISAGIPRAIVKEYIGHATTKMSEGYTHIELEALIKAAAALPKI